jgi:hypothetical protein
MMQRDLGQPWALAPLNGKYYGTRILDRNGDEVMKFAGKNRDDDDGKPSERWRAEYGTDWEPYDWHYERHDDLEWAKELIRVVNEAAESY